MSVTTLQLPTDVYTVILAKWRDEVGIHALTLQPSGEWESHGMRYPHNGLEEALAEFSVVARPVR